MDDASLATSAAAGASAVVRAAGTATWAGLREQLAHWFGRGDPRQEQATLRHLDTSAADLARDTGETRRRAQEELWRARFHALLTGLPEAERAPALRSLRAVLDRWAEAAGQHVRITAEGGSIAAGTVQGSAVVVPPSLAGSGTELTGIPAPSGPPRPDDPAPEDTAPTGTTSTDGGSTGSGGVTASGGSIAIGGDVHGNVTHLAMPRGPARWPHQVGVIPPQAGSFQQRAASRELRRAVANGGTAVLCQVLSGMGGVGKTQLAADYARAAWSPDPRVGDVDVLVWVTANTRDALLAGFAQAGVELCGADPDDTEQAARRFLAWLQPKSGATPCRWLIVLDDLAEPADLRGLWPPAADTGRTLVTTRRRDDPALSGRGHILPVGLFTEAEALRYLTEVLTLYGREEPAGELAALAAELGHLPLALSQAAAYLTETFLSCAAYRALLAERRRGLAELVPEDRSLPDDQTATVAVTWALSIERADALRPAGLAAPLLRLTSMLAANGVPEKVVTNAYVLGHLAEHRRHDGGPAPHAAVTRDEALGALLNLHRLNLIDRTPDTPHQTVRTHQLIQRAVQDSLTPEAHRLEARRAADALLAAWPEVEHDTGLVQALRANAAALTEHAEVQLHRLAAHPVLFRAGESLGRSGAPAAARAYFAHLVETTHAQLGPDHPDSLSARGGHAYWSGEAGEAAGAAAALERLLPDWLRVRGPEHPDTLGARQNIAFWRGTAGDAAGAMTALNDLLADQRRVLGPEHPDTLTTRHDLAFWRGQIGDAAGAVTALNDLLADQRRVLGPDHPDTLSTRHNIARIRGESGDAAGAVEQFEDLLPDLVRVRGADYTETLTVRHNLAHFRGLSGDLTGAVTGMRTLLTDRLRVQGPEDPSTLTTRHLLARWQAESGEVTEAITALTALVTDQTRVQGPDHPDVLRTRHTLARCQAKAGDPAGATRALTTLLADQTRVQGPDHPEVLRTRHTLAHSQAEAGETTKAVTALTALLADQTRVQGPNHPATTATREELTRRNPET